MNLSEVKASVMVFFETLENAERQIPDLRERAQRFKEQAERRAGISDQIAELQQQRVPLESELASLKPAYLDALYEMNEPLQAKLQARKTELEGELEALDRSIEDKRGELEPIDQQELAELWAELDSFKTPEVFAFVRGLDRPLQRAANALKADVSGIDTGLPSSDDEETYRATRMELDASYRYQQGERERTARKIEAMKPHRYVDGGDSTSSWLEANGLVTGEGEDRITSTISERPPLLDED